ncbi:MAG: excinuclease ABC subunit UvrC [Gammaproteobacteria bacterium]|nr:excinuclease ABC subunit UvrC [Gammaproteobacteria bacterium]
MTPNSTSSTPSTEKADPKQSKQSAFDAKNYIRSLTNKPGIYQMCDSTGKVLYVGKALNLKKRVASYFRTTNIAPKTRALVTQIAAIEVIVTHTEDEALILENNLIKKLKPRYNILLRDDKSYPYIYLSSDHDFPRLSFYRGAKKEPGRYFGPFPSGGAVRESLNLMQKLFPVRQCEESFFRNRSRPCLQYQIKRCTAPCVSLVDKPRYEQDVRHAVMFLEGKNSEVINELAKKMEQASAQLNYESAARYRDQIAALRRVQEKQYISSGTQDVDVIASVVQGGVGCVQVFFIRGGLNLGNKTFFPRLPDGADAIEQLSAFIPQYYLNKEPPGEILVNQPPTDSRLLCQVLSAENGRQITISHNVRGDRLRWLKMAESNAAHAIAHRLADRTGTQQRFEALSQALQLHSTPQRIECFDISHTMGEATVASCVVFGTEGALKPEYRRFNIKGITPGDDYAAMNQALTRRYTRAKKGECKLPDMLLIDGGKGQLREAEEVLEELQITGVTLIGVAKGPQRKAGHESLFLSGSQDPVILPGDSAASHLIQQIRDEAHRFALTGHRQRRAKSRTSSPLEIIPGMGPKRRRQLLQQFGGLQGVSRAGIEELANVPGISKQLARRVYDAFHEE